MKGNGRKLGMKEGEEGRNGNEGRGGRKEGMKLGEEGSYERKI